ncbi:MULTISPECIES: hypothetical protein [Paenibacillus]|uniref:hypothetical protein n=1 Tax=Paenibacillus TaxID=44249 RepID=UPI001916679A|nr:hypothetical protein [Paenibacillus sp. EPM92]
MLRLGQRIRKVRFVWGRRRRGLATVLFAMTIGGLDLMTLPSFACACEGAEPRAHWMSWLVMGFGVFVGLAMLVFSVVIAVKAWRRRY